jgi:PAS domain S-box-containing protein
VAIPPTGLLFALGYTGRAHGGPKFLAFVVPGITLVLLYTNGLHHLHWATVGYRKVGRFSALVLTYGPWFWIFILHQYALLIGGAAIVAVDFFASRRFYSRQARLVVFGAAAPLAFNALYLLRLLPGVTKDFTPVAFALSGIAFAIGVRRYRLFEMVPVAYRAAFDAMADPVFIIDSDGLLVDVNATAAKLFSLTHDELGMAAAEVPAIYDAIRSAEPAEGGRSPSEFSFETPEGKRWFEAVARRLGPGGGVRTLYSLRDVTERRAMFMEKSELVDKLTAALAEINDLRGIIPICAKCKKMRDDAGYWHQLESYFAARSEIQFTHGLCPECTAEALAEIEGMETPTERNSVT